MIPQRQQGGITDGHGRVGERPDAPHPAPCGRGRSGDSRRCGSYRSTDCPGSSVSNFLRTDAVKCRRSGPEGIGAAAIGSSRGSGRATTRRDGGQKAGEVRLDWRDVLAGVVGDQTRVEIDHEAVERVAARRGQAGRTSARQQGRECGRPARAAKAWRDSRSAPISGPTAAQSVSSLLAVSIRIRDRRVGAEAARQV